MGTPRRGGAALSGVMAEISLPVFEGPLDLLLHLIERDDLDITAVSLVSVTDQYLKAIRGGDGFEPHALAEFVSVGAKLIHIKSKALLPRDIVDPDAELDEIGHRAAAWLVGTDAPRLDRLLNESRVDVAIMHAPEPFQAAKRGWQVVEDLGRLDGLTGIGNWVGGCRLTGGQGGRKSWGAVAGVSRYQAAAVGRVGGFCPAEGAGQMLLDRSSASGDAQEVLALYHAVALRFA